MFGLSDCRYSENLCLQSIVVECKIINLLVVCSTEFVYLNNTESNIDTIFSFPLEGTCVVYHFEAMLDNKSIVGICKELDEAKNMYKAAIQAGHKAAMIERYVNMPDVFKCRIGNFPKHSVAKIKVKFLMELKLSLEKSKCIEFDRFNLCLPLILRPRYTPMDSVGDSEVFLVSNKYHYEFYARVSGTKEIKNLFSTNNKLDLIIFNNNTSATVTLESQYDGSHDLDIIIDYVKMRVPSVIYEYGSSSALFQGTKLNSAFFQPDVVMLNFLPEFDKSKKPNIKIEIVFIVDRSGSMGGSNILRAKECLLIFLKSLPVDCKIQIYGFGSNFDKAFSEPVFYDNRSISQAMEYQRSINADFGGTELMKPLSDLYNTALTNDYKRLVFLLTDGDIGNQDEVFKLVRQHNNSTRIFAVGIGDGVSTSLVQKVAEYGLGKSVFVRDSKALSASVIELLDIALNCDQMTDCKIEWQCPDDVAIVTVPTTIGPIFSHYFLTVFGMVKGLKANETVKCTLSGQIAGHPVRFPLEVTNSNGVSDDEFMVHRLLAKCKIDELTPLIEDGRYDLKKQLIDISLSANLVTNYTTFVAIDPEIPDNAIIAAEESHYELDCDYSLFSGGEMYDQVDGPIGSYDQLDGLRLFSANVCHDVAYDAMSCEDEDDEAPYLCAEESAYSDVRKGAFLNSYGSDEIEADGKVDRSADHYKPALLSKSKKDDRDLVILLADEQNIDGSWEFKEHILIRIGIDPVKMKDEKPDSISDTVWITVLIWLYLSEKLPLREKEWRLFAKKAKDWIDSNINDTARVEYICQRGLQLIKFAL